MDTLSQKEFDQKTIKVLADAVSQAINENEGNKRFIDLERIPLICLAISNISKALDEIKEMMASNRHESDKQHKAFVTKESLEQQLSPLRAVVYGGVALVLITTGGALIALVIK